MSKIDIFVASCGCVPASCAVILVLHAIVGGASTPVVAMDKHALVGGLVQIVLSEAMNASEPSHIEFHHELNSCQSLMRSICSRCTPPLHSHAITPVLCYAFSF
jgi:hypothetical protein